MRMLRLYSKLKKILVPLLISTDIESHIELGYSHFLVIYLLSEVNSLFKSSYALLGTEFSVVIIQNRKAAK